MGLKNWESGNVMEQIGFRKLFAEDLIQEVKWKKKMGFRRCE